MSEHAPESVLKRKAGAGRAAAGDPAPTPARLFGQAFAKAAQEMLKLAVAVDDATETRVSAAEIPELLPDRALLAVIEGPGEGLGLAVLSAETLASLIEIQTTGRIGGADVAARRPTRTDAAMSARFLDRVLGTAETLLASDPALTWAGGFRYASFLEDPRPLALILEEPAYRVIALALRFGAEAARQGTLLIALPAAGRGAAPAPRGGTGPESAKDAAAARVWSDRIEAAVMGAGADLEAVLDRVRLPLAEVLALKPGAMLTLSKGVLSRLRVEGRGPRLIGYGRLGQCQGSYAVRLLVGIEEPETGAALPEPAEPGPAAGQA
ncbi:FliM/FliN family flagellar motor C-terminal domain-containing protein [Defluviimonas sp. WL0024]|uniref:FliM/FliN family flagellar motor C-terminal domain-containing protein n=1 Tax=Albidovulum salinarum TaxID=2984153 RepID=A0ABT2WZ61_9RHOB|nr:FliM/FliN family flagellar motor C-terminal domain-containing protein [Defluviimonas sp. WL0024]MCU9846966.1 FliM/FliN family flagellar motor C-terminal domain-containing protein [Defluviimonas sp. WL0024]